MGSIGKKGQEKRTEYAPPSQVEWNAERRAMETLDTSLAGRRILVMDVEPMEKGELGYTSKGSVIHVARDHEYYKRFSKKDAAVFRFGVNVHEALHQVYTDFETFYGVLEGILMPSEQKMFAQIFNLVEDPAIENFAAQAVGGFALDCLYFTIEKIYESALPVSGPQNHGQALEEYLDALIQFGDRGIIKGGFSSDLAREYFNRTAPIIYRAINEPDGAKRVRLALDVYNIAKTLWAGKPPQKVKQAFQSVTGRYAKSVVSGSGRGNTPQGTEDARNSRREDEIRRQKRKEEEALEKDAGFIGLPEGTSMEQDADKKTGSESEEPSGSGSGRVDPVKSIDGDTGEKTKENDGKTLIRKNGDEHVRAESADNGFSQENTNKDGQNDDEPVFQYDPDIANKFAEAMKRYIAQADAGPGPERDTEKPESYATVIQSGNRQFTGVKEKNATARPEGMGGAYADILDTAAWITGPLVTQLKKIFTDDRGGKTYAQRGKASLKRAASGRITTRMFERRILPGDKADMCLMLLIDLSGSMNGDKEQAAKLAAIVLCEAFACFRIPVYCMGFQHAHGADAYQTHFVRWRNTIDERMSILSASPSGGNFDSYSIRYAIEALRKRQEKHKLMCAISDGLPSHFFTGNIGIQENTKAIQDARLMGADVFGMAVGDADGEKFREMYGKDSFIRITRPQDLADQAAGLIRTIVRGWR